MPRIPDNLDILRLDHAHVAPLLGAVWMEPDPDLHWCFGVDLCPEEEQPAGDPPHPGSEPPESGSTPRPAPSFPDMDDDIPF